MTSMDGDLWTAVWTSRLIEVRLKKQSNPARAVGLDSRLGATAFGSDLAKCQEVAGQIEAGSVWINSGPRPGAFVHFGGVKDSGIGTEFGTNGILAYANIKAIHTYKP
jgi:acyl-CoA reductase-like NAD-dependent aldehyde dehydrogenase